MIFCFIGVFCCEYSVFQIDAIYFTSVIRCTDVHNVYSFSISLTKCISTVLTHILENETYAVPWETFFIHELLACIIAFYVFISSFTCLFVCLFVCYSSARFDVT
jgi:hypothetical protein